MQYIETYLADAHKIIDQIDKSAIKKIVEMLITVRRNQRRLFILGVGGGAGHASHAVNDFRKICGIEAYTPTDNVSELTARINDAGWETTYVNWLKISKIDANDMVLVFSVGGGSIEKNISMNIVKSLELAKQVGAKIVGIVGRDGGYTAEVADACVIIPPLNKATVTPQTEGFQAVVWHLIVSHPDLQKFDMKWESMK